MQDCNVLGSNKTFLSLSLSFKFEFVQAWCRNRLVWDVLATGTIPSPHGNVVKLWLELYTRGRREQEFATTFQEGKNACT